MIQLSTLSTLCFYSSKGGIRSEMGTKYNKFLVTNYKYVLIKCIKNNIQNTGLLHLY